MAAIPLDTAPTDRPHEYVSLWICRKNQSKVEEIMATATTPAPPALAFTRDSDYAKGALR